ncbi:MAG: YcaO-related McrA-glycine thioamidation protein [Methanomicrobiales archaeon]|nr:YcaO-related McrA-glycine thioamidation protein [Methanomicrobiales archaeon]
MKLSSCRKLYSRETQRAAPPEETLERAEGKLPAAGITRIADITQLDRVGIPVFSCIRPTAVMGAVSVYNGKGATPLAARVSAMMEGIERYSGEAGDREMVYSRYEERKDTENVLDPRQLILPYSVDPSGILPWVEGYDLAGDDSILVPAQAVFHPLFSPYPPLFRTNTNGLASGNTREEAIFHALTEVIERDAWSLVETLRNAGPRIAGADGETVTGLLERFHRAEIEVHLRDITSDLGIPTIAAVADDLLLKDPALLTIGMGTHTSATIAAIRALTEVAQSRLTQIHGAREDIPHTDVRKRLGYERTKRLNRYWFQAETEVPMEEIRSLDTPDFLEDIMTIVGSLREKGLTRVIAVDLTRPEIGIPVVRVIVPGLEVYAIDNERRGERCRNARNHRLSRPESGTG